ncbi:MAG: TatD family hydrolase [Coriobacteriia bacterium]|jgi:TatD DNase family protein|nr:TatD family hydrolase [Coriobacteriia bacterium]
MADERSVQLPVLGRIADTHAHLDMLDDPVAALVNAAQAGVAFIATVADVTEDAERTFDSLEGWRSAAADILVAADPYGPQVPDVRIVVGAHPHNASALDASAEDRIRALARDSRVAAIGEAGLDFHYDNSPRDDQRRAFCASLGIAHDLELPVVVHLREAHEEGMEILAEMGVPAAGCIIHCFTEDAPLALRFVEMGCHVSFAGPVTFKKAVSIREAAALVPLDRLLVETDSPFLAPEPYRGRRNEPAWVTLTAAMVAGERTESPADVVRASYANAIALLGTRKRAS